MTKSTITRERLEQLADNTTICKVSWDERIELAQIALVAMDSESGCLPLDYLQGHKDGLEWAAQLAEANHPETGDWLYDDPIELAKAIRKGPDMPPAQSVDSEPVAYIFKHPAGRLFWALTDESNKGQSDVMPVYAEPQPAPVVPDGYVMVPMRLTAENGAKGALSGEFSETKFVNCPECFGDDECETCDGSGRIEITVPVTWTTIKAIWVKGVEHFSATPREVKGE
ncbi:TPA: hypothetical protein ACJ2OR_001952 [Klebsiella pneumoniae]